MTARLSQYVRVVLADPTLELGARARHLLEVLAHYADHTGTAWPSVPTLAGRMGVTAANVRRARAELVNAGLIAVDLSPGGRRGADGLTNRYRFPVMTPLDLVHIPRASARGSDTDPRAPAREPPRASARDPRAPARAKDSIEGAIEGDVPTWVGQRWPLTIHVEQVPDGATWSEYG